VLLLVLIAGFSLFGWCLAMDAWLLQRIARFQQHTALIDSGSDNLISAKLGAAKESE
jgi:hypothetical protein